MSTFAIIDPDDGTTLGLYSVPWWTDRTQGLAPYSGFLEFAGDPRTGEGILKSNIGRDRYWQFGSRPGSRQMKPEIQALLARARKTTVLLGDRPSNAMLSPWIADHPF